MGTNITIIGFGTMGRAIAQALIQNGKNIKISAIDKTYGKFPKVADFIILAVKPKDIGEVAKTLKNKIKPNSIVISILAGMKIKTLSSLLGTKKIIRMMPNLGLSVGAGIAVWKMGNGFTIKEKSRAKKFINLICENIETRDEKIINAVTAISGSGLAYFFLLADYMQKTAKKLNLKEEIGRKLVAKTLLACALLQKNTKYQELISKIALRGGTTEAALKVFQKANFRKIVSRAIKAANKRAIELNRK